MHLSGIRRAHGAGIATLSPHGIEPSLPPISQGTMFEKWVMKQEFGPNAQNIILSLIDKSCRVRSPTVHWVGYVDVAKVRKGEKEVEGFSRVFRSWSQGGALDS